MRNIFTKLSLIGLTLALTLVGSGLFGSGSAQAYSNNNMIDDAVFDNTNSMSTAQIQSFLNQFPNSCIKNYQAPDPITDMNNWSHYGALVPASQVIKDAATRWGINPQVILTTLQKEEQLIDGSQGCANWKLWSAMGYNCPSSATYTYSVAQLTTSPINYSEGLPADMQNGAGPTCANKAQGVGFSAQVYHGAWQLEFGRQRSEGDGNLNWDTDNYVPYYGYMTATAAGQTRPLYQGDPNPVGYSGNITLSDGANVSLANGATASLYSYTPYIQSFDSIFEGWFGSSHIPSYSVQINSIDVNADLGHLISGQTAVLTYHVTNTGSATWSQGPSNPVRLGTSNPQNRISPFCNPATWVVCSRPAALQEASVAPGGTGTFVITLKAPETPGDYFEYYQPLSEDLSWFSGFNNNVFIHVDSRKYTYSISGQAAYTDNLKTTGVDLAKLSPGQTAWLTLQVKNTGNMTWSNTGSNPVDLGIDNPRDSASRYWASGWLGPNRPTRIMEASVAPGATGTFEWPIKVQNGGGNYFDYVTPVVEGVAWMNTTGLNYFTHVNATYSWALASQAAYTDAGYTAPADLGNLHVGDVTYWQVKAKNTGTATWFNSGTYPLDLATTHPQDRSSSFCDTPWLGCNRPARLKEASVAPGQIGTFEFKTTATKTGTYLEYFNPVAEYITFLNDIGMNFYIIVR